jgi:gas vesicle protein
MSMYQGRGYETYEDFNDDYRGRSGSGATNTILSMLGGAAVGAALMYLFDPNEGQQRRQHVGSYTGDALKGTSQTLGIAASQLAEKAKDLSQSLVSGLGTGATAATDATSSAASKAYNSVADRTASMFGRQRQTNDEWLGDVDSHDHSLSAPTAGLSAVGMTLATVLGLYMLDPEKRRVMMDGVHQIVRQTGETFHSLGQRFAGGGSRQQQQQSGHMDYATSDDYIDRTAPEVGRSTPQSDVPPTTGT